eukprot:GEMP01044258.1.p1 GENE.GEMP01044258.1~~GEMP01044258.1.p1  ORF type:complete len:187 (+),score=42.01 GEMP01044258.1:102-662(+)
MLAPAKAKAKAKADAAFAKAMNQANHVIDRAVEAKTAAYVKAGFPAPPPLQNVCGLSGAPPAQAAAPAAGAFAQAMAAPPAPTWRERSRINHAKAPAWPAGADYHKEVYPRNMQIATAFDQTWLAVKATNKRMRAIGNDSDAKTRPNTIPDLVANAIEYYIVFVTRVFYSEIEFSVVNVSYWTQCA